MTWDYGGVARLQKQRDAVLEVQAIVKTRVEPIVGLLFGKLKIGLAPSPYSFL